MWNNVTEEQWLFMKEISSDGDVNTVCVSYIKVLILEQSLSVVGHGSGVQRDRNPWSCEDRKGYSPEDQYFF